MEDMKIKSLLLPSLFAFFCLFFIIGQAQAAILDVPFTSQAPERNWSEPWLNACEETSIAMVHAYYQGKIFTVAKAKTAILEVFTIKHKKFGVSFDESSSKVTSLIQNFYPWDARVQEYPTLAQIKEQLDLQHPVIIPVYGKGLHNPHFRNGGPLYHMLVLSGYDDEKQQFIAQEPGSRFGNNYRYSYTTIMFALHDYVPGRDIRTTKPVAIFTEPNTTKTSLVKTASDSKVYLIQNGARRHILNEKVFLGHGWQWEYIVTVNETFLQNIPEAEQLTN